MANRLARETSPYLQQHAGNPVDWFPWGAEALERARTEDKPILLSVGYSACHWCHVMAHESFEDPGVAAVMNRHFVNVKVDREERPDLDQIYQSAHQMLARGAGGWPLTMFLSPDGTPFFGGTYFPKSARYGLPGFQELLERVAAIWRERRAEIGEQNERLRLAFARTLPKAGTHRSSLERAPLEAMLGNMRASFDARHGGFGGAPKFPHPADLELCLRLGEHGMVHKTLASMCEGGIYDQLGGGFCRYSVDERWEIPHFEKMLYDNGPLLGLLADLWLVTGEAPFERCAHETAAWMLREMQSPEGGFYSSLDADSEHEEGKFYVWDRDEVRSILSDEEFFVASPHFGLNESPNFEGRRWHLHVAAPSGNDDLLRSAKAKLLAAREKRLRPGRDEKVLVSWNALAIKGLARGGRALAKPEWIAAARRALYFIRERMWRDGRLLATYKDGRAHLAAYLDDYAFMIAALLELLQCEYRREDLEAAAELAEVLLDQFEDREHGGFFFTARDAERLVHRPKPGHDSAMPSGNGVAALALGRLAALTGEDRYARAAERTLELFYPAMCDYPAGFGALGLALSEALTPPSVLILRGLADAMEEWRAALSGLYLPDGLILAIPDGAAGLPPALDKPRGKAPVTGWVCRGATCLAPENDLEALKRSMIAPHRPPLSTQ
jgi:hypothetical protein